MERVAAFTICICILSASATPCPSAANDGIVIGPIQRAEKLVQPRSEIPLLGDFGSIEDWLLKRLRSPDKRANV